MTTLKRLFWQAKWEGVKKSLCSFYPQEKMMMPLYKKTFLKILCLEAAENKERVTFSLSPADDSREEYPYEVRGLEHYEDGAYAVRRWEDWMGFFVGESTLSEIPKEDVVAVCLYHMVLVCGFDQNDFFDELEEELNGFEIENEALKGMKTVKEVLSGISWECVEPCLLAEFPAESAKLEKYKSAFLKLQELDSSAPSRFAVEAVFEGGSWCFLRGAWVRDFGTTEKMWDAARYPFLPWRDWLSTRVPEELLSAWGAGKIAAALLYEITHYGFSESEIFRKRDVLENLPHSMIEQFFEIHREHC